MLNQLMEGRPVRYEAASAMPTVIGPLGADQPRRRQNSDNVAAVSYQSDCAGANPRIAANHIQFDSGHDLFWQVPPNNNHRDDGVKGMNQDYARSYSDKGR